MEKFQRIHHSVGEEPRDIKRVVTALSENLGRVFDDIAARPQLDSRLIEKATSATLTGLALVRDQENLIVHGLGRAVRGWHLVDIRGPAFVWRVADSDADLTLYLPLSCSHSVTVTLVVF